MNDDNTIRARICAQDLAQSLDRAFWDDQRKDFHLKSARDSFDSLARIMSDLDASGADE